MKQPRIILAGAILVAAAAGIWAWHENSQPAEPPLAHTDTSSFPAQPFQPSLNANSPSSPAPAPVAPPSPPSQPPAVTPENAEAATGAAVEPPNVDMPEPAERKFAKGGHADSDQN